MRSRLATAVFLEFRTIPVLLWSYTAVTLGAAAAAAETHRFDPLVFVLSMAVAMLIQGFATHAINEIYDLRSGTDLAPLPRRLSGGSRVLTAGLLTVPGMWAVFAISSFLIALVTAGLVALRDLGVAAFVSIGYAAGLAYTVPPIATSYRPFLGEWLGGFLGVFAGSLGAYYAQAGTVSPLALVVAGAHAFVCVGMLLVHHDLDRIADATSRPPKRTTVVELGLPAAQMYTIAVASASILLFAVAWILGGPAFIVALVAGLVGLAAHIRLRPSEVDSVTRGELRIIQSGIAGGLGSAILLAPVLWPVGPIALAGYIAHLRIGARYAAPSATARPVPRGVASPPP